MNGFVKRYWKLHFIATLVAVNAVLYFQLRKRELNIKQSFEELTGSPVQYFFEDDSHSKWFRYSSYKAQSVRDYRQVLGVASDSLTLVIRKIQQENIVGKLTTTSPEEYFSKKLTIAPSLQTALQAAFEKYNAGVTHFLEADFPGKMAMRDSLSEVMRKNLREAEAKFKNLPHGKPQSIVLVVPWKNNGYEYFYDFTISGIPGESSVQWQMDTPYYLGYDDYVNLMIQLKESAHSANVLHLQTAQQKMNNLFATPGKVEVYGKMYELSTISMGELDSVCKYILLQQWKTNKALIAAVNELSQLRSE